MGNFAKIEIRESSLCAMIKTIFKMYIFSLIYKKRDLRENM